MALMLNIELILMSSKHNYRDNNVEELMLNKCTAYENMDLTLK